MTLSGLQALNKKINGWQHRRTNMPKYKVFTELYTLGRSVSSDKVIADDIWVRFVNVDKSNWNTEGNRLVLVEMFKASEVNRVEEDKSDNDD